MTIFLFEELKRLSRFFMVVNAGWPSVPCGMEPTSIDHHEGTKEIAT